MFGTLRRWILGDPRRIFRYWDGRRYRRADPLEIEADLDTACPEWATHLRTLAAPDVPIPGPVLEDQRANKKGATAALVKATQNVFGLTPLTDEEGLTQAETIGVLAAYLNFMGTLADLARPTLGWSGSGNPSPPTSPTEPSVASYG